LSNFITAREPVNPMILIYCIAAALESVESFIVCTITFQPKNNLITEDVLIIAPFDKANQGTIAVKTTAEGPIAISAKEGPAQEFAKKLLQRCAENPGLCNTRIILYNNRHERCHS